jgi:hypothetical protein
MQQSHVFVKTWLSFHARFLLLLLLAIVLICMDSIPTLGSATESGSLSCFEGCESLAMLQCHQLRGCIWNPEASDGELWHGSPGASPPRLHGDVVVPLHLLWERRVR